MEDLSKRQKSILQFIIDEIKSKGYPPSVREIGKAVGLKSPASVHSHLKTLEKLNYLRRDPSKPRAIEVIYNNDQENKNDKEMINIPVVGKVTAGAPILAEENIEDYFPLPLSYLKVGNNDLVKIYNEEISGNASIDLSSDKGDIYLVFKEKITGNVKINAKSNRGNIYLKFEEAIRGNPAITLNAPNGSIFFYNNVETVGNANISINAKNVEYRTGEPEVLKDY